MPEQRKIPLPDGWRVKEEHAIGVTYFDETGRPVLQHPYDTDAALSLAIVIYRRRAQSVLVDQHTSITND